MKYLAITLAILGLLAAPALAQTLPEDDIETMVTNTGSYDLIKYGLAGRERVASIYGFVNDKSACEKFAKRLNDETSHHPFTCEPK